MTDIQRAPQPSVATAVGRSATPRRIVVGTLLAPFAWWGLVSAGGGLAGAQPIWIALVSLAAVLGSAGLATYVPAPGAGRAPVWGCAPCAVAAAVSLPVAAFMLSVQPGVVSTAGMAAIVTAIGLFQRLRDPKACPTAR